jgi:hypothetical protein
MIHDLKLYLYKRTSLGETSVAVHKSFETLIDEWTALRERDEKGSCLVFAGYSRPSIQDVDRVLSWPSYALVAESARWLLPSTLTVHSTPVEGIKGNANYPDMPIYLGLAGWSYDPVAVEDKLRAIIPNPTSNEPRSAFGFDSVSASDDPFVLARHLPEWALIAAMRDLPLTVRCRNVVEDQGLETISDLTLWSAESAKSWKNFGRQSMKDLADAIRRFIGGGPGRLAPTETLPSSMDLPPLLQCLDNALMRLAPRDSGVIRSRWGYQDGQRRTLEDIAEEMGVTRERVRQIELKGTKQLSAEYPWTASIGERIRLLLRRRTEPLFLHFLEIEDPWFVGFAENSTLLASLLAVFNADDCHVLVANGHPVVSLISQDVWDTTKTAILEALRQRGEEKLEIDSVKLLVEAMIPKATELTTPMFDELRDQLTFVSRNGRDVLVSVGKKTITAIAAVLEEADEPLHYSEVWRLCEARLGRPVQRQYVHNTLMSMDALYFDRGTYGTWKHYPIAKSQQDLIVEAIDEIVRGNELDRQWHTEELLSRLSGSYDFLTAELNKHLLDLLLRRTSTLKPVGRMVWIPMDSTSTIRQGRIDIIDASVRILMDAGKPMRFTAIRSALQMSRGIGRNFQLHSTRELTRTAPRVWGLVRRDFGLDDEQYERLIDAAIQIVSLRGEMVETEELEGVLRADGVVSGTLSSFVFMSLLQTSRILHVFRGHMVGLADWASNEEQENDALIEFEEPNGDEVQPNSKSEDENATV